jgi:hypothetical protein
MRRIAPVFIATIAIATTISVHVWRQLHEERQKTAQLRDRVSYLELAPNPSGVAMVIPMDPVPGAPASGKAGFVVAANETAVTHRSVRPAAPAPSSARELMNDPEVRKARIAQLRLRLPRGYPDLAEELGLLDQEVDALFDTLAEQQTDMMIDVISASTEPPGQETARTFAERMQVQQARVLAQLGPEKHAKFEEYQRTLATRRQVEELRADLATTEYPLTEQQRRPLVAALIAERQGAEVRARGSVGAPSGRSEILQENLRSMEERNQRVLDAAQPLLSSPQLAALRRSMGRQLALNQASMRAQYARQ